MNAPRIPRDRILNTGEMWWLAITVGISMWGALFLLVRWIAQ